MLLNKKSFAALALLISISGHASDATPEIDSEKLGAVKTVTVVYPGKAVYIAFGPSGPIHIPIPIPGAGVVGALATGAIAGAVNAGLNKSENDSPTSLNDLVTAKLGDTGLNRRFTDSIETVLRNHGFTVKEVDASSPGLPTVKPDEHRLWQASGSPYQGSDAVLYIRVGTGYVTPGARHAYTRRVIGDIVMFKSDTYDAILRQHVSWKQSNDPYSYPSIESLESDLQHAIDGLNEGLMAQVDPFNKLFDSLQR
ncbi:MULTISPECIES: hypothetical protein [Burkholderia]|uniref:Lipoprotein n=1 Tax=Burkholderia anthinoferrum TaxID=3090833 RepID=A0ABU5WUY5_9BURK|nr:MULTISPECIES: hypothetical protein [Burkholderia]MEB2502454.1 hypothetical protein [Burkholderia anthinoferrum]MEB2534624.1 hypothetical protein [Burkholderia anthinoferrum]MEB2563255.1 hypothetical protein [Burkholderia anthinoferrum]MEB2582600.1 hypothetical protein [Burkholderia anthinoferrum]KVH09336.1 hypothetical protein WS85_19970 [Burkholderia anthina]